MAILRALDGRFYEVPDDQAGKFAVPEDKVKDKLDQAGVVNEGPPPPDEGPPPYAMMASGPTVLVQIFGGTSGGVESGAVQPYAWGGHGGHGHGGHHHHHHHGHGWGGGWGGGWRNGGWGGGWGGGWRNGGWGGGWGIWGS